jgi:tRNA A37 threonylcarbamoyladenosine biosynthesis protein TsaE
MKMYNERHKENKDKIGWRFIYNLANDSNSIEKEKIDAKYRAIKRDVEKAERKAKNNNNDLTESKVESNDTLTFRKLYPKFEKTHAKIINKSSFIKETDEDVIVMSKSQIRTAYEHIQCGYATGNVPKLFIDKWLVFNDDIRKYDDMNIYPDASVCPENIYNMWRPFAMELETSPYEKNDIALQFILNHIKILCNHEEPVFDFVKKWIAQMIQYPAVKTFVITLISAQGAGKGTLMKLLSKMLGHKKVLETTTPSRDVWGQFNGLMPNYYLINLNELSKKETIESEGQFKQMATDGAMTINQKGVAQYNINSYHRFIITTNNPDPIKTTKDDRRNVIIKASDELIRNKEYFNKIHDFLEDVNVVRTCYDYFKSIEGMEKFGSIPIPKTEHQNNLKEGSRGVVDLWLEHFTRENIHVLEVEKTPTEIFTNFVIWRDENDFIYVINKHKFGIGLNIVAKGSITIGRHTTRGDTKKFDIDKLKKMYNIGICMVHS